MAAYRPRDDAAGAPSRRYADPRASTGAVFASSFDTRYTQLPRSSIDTLAPSRGDGRAYEVQPIKRRTYVDSGYAGGTTSRTEYAVRPRQNSLLGDENRRPASVIVPPMSPTRTRPIITSIPDIRERPSSPVQRATRARDDSERYLQPASSGARQSHNRHYSANSPGVERLSVGNRDRRERVGYHRAGGSSGPPTYLAARPPIRYSEEDGYSYTTAREGFDNLYPSRVAPRNDDYTRRDRPSSVYEISELDQPYLERRNKGLPPAIRQPEAGRVAVRSEHESDTDRHTELPTRRHSTRAPIVHQSRDEGYGSQKDDYDERRRVKHVRDKTEDDDWRGDERDLDRVRHHESRRLPRSRDSSPERSGIGKGIAAAALGGVAAGGAAGALARSRDKDDDSDPGVRRERRRRKHRERDPGEDVVAASAGAGLDSKPRGDRFGDKYDSRNLPRDKYDTLRDEEESGSAEDQRRVRRSRRRRQHDKDKPRNEVDSDSASDRVDRVDRVDRHSSREASREKAVPADPTRSAVRDRDTDADGMDRRRGDRPARSGPEDPSTDLGPRTVSPGEDEDDRPRRVLLVEPPREKNEENKPRGILKPARQVPFPEDPNPTREGVAPLKEAGKEGIPPGARWTKISRVLVNPEALEKLHERFEEREDYVIVLRVVTKEEIAKFAEKTREIREARELEWQAELDRKKKEKSRSRRDHSGDEEDDDDKDKRPPLTIEPPPAAPFTHGNMRNQPPADPLGRSLPGTPAVADMAASNGAVLGQANQISGAYDAEVPETYSTNV